MNYKKLAQILMKEIRGSSSQNMINKSLGFSYNQYAKWENGRAHISWKQFVKLCHLLKIDLQVVLNTACSYPYKTVAPKPVITFLFGGDSIHQFAKKHDLSRFKLARWASEKNEPALHDILEILDLSAHFRLSRFLSNFRISSEIITNLSITVHSDEPEHHNPIYHLAIDCLSIKEYTDQPTHTKGFLAKKLGISLEEESELIDYMISNGMLKRKNQKLTAPDRYIESTRPPNIEDQLDFFHSRSRKYFVKNKERTDINHLVLGTMSIHTNTLKKIKCILFQAQEDLYKSILEGSKKHINADQVAHLVIQLYDPTEID